MTDTGAAKRFHVPHTLVLLLGMIVLAYGLTLVLPAGSYERVTNEAGREQVVPGSYERLADVERLPPTEVFTAIPHGFEAAGEIIFFILIIGGMFGVFRATGAADAAIGSMLRRFGGRPALLLGGTMAIFALGSATIGMAEEYIPFLPLLVALTAALGMDAIVAVGVMCVGYGVGYGAALINPFTVFIAQDIAGIPQGSGLALRAVLLVLFFFLGFHHVWRYAKRIQANPEESLVADIDTDVHIHARDDLPLTGRRRLVLVSLGLALVVLIYGLKVWHWYLVEMGALFLCLSVIMAIIGRISADDAAKQFGVGASELTMTALLVGFARSIQVVLENGQVVDTIIAGMANPLQRLGPELAAAGMFMFQSVLNFFIPSGSGQAYVTMPLMAPLADLVDVSRQVAVLAYQFGDGFTNILVPTNAVLIGILSIAAVPYDRWVRFLLPFMLKVWLFGSLALVIAVMIGYA
ncbi:MAG: TIGR00366 family protein [Gemmatimonadota bacterium]|nr:TIGR00366 family protein [Gemmatimonadota bacterium]MDH3428141.1 TIGR00366 family protein [Gemmatimonadota bacterium]